MFDPAPEFTLKSGWPATILSRFDPGKIPRFATVDRPLL
jgi:hypothetical protein